jgi:hypothetical protein
VPKPRDANNTIEFSAHGTLDLQQLTATVTQVCNRTTTTIPVVLTRDVQPIQPIVNWLTNHNPVNGRPNRAPLDLIHFNTSNFPNGAAAFDRVFPASSACA